MIFVNAITSKSNDELKGKLLFKAVSTPSAGMQFIEERYPFIIVFILSVFILPVSLLVIFIPNGIDPGLYIIACVMAFISVLSLVLSYQYKAPREETSIHCYEYELHYYKGDMLVFSYPWEDLRIKKVPILGLLCFTSKSKVTRGPHHQLNGFSLDDMGRIVELSTNRSALMPQIDETTHIDDDKQAGVEVHTLKRDIKLLFIWGSIIGLPPAGSAMLLLFNLDVLPEGWLPFNEIPPLVAIWGAFFVGNILIAPLHLLSKRRLYFYAEGVYWYKRKHQVNKSWADLDRIEYRWFLNRLTFYFQTEEKITVGFIRPEAAQMVQDYWHQILEEKRGD